MTKGKLGLPLAVVAAIAFVFCAVRQPLAVLLVAGVALLAEKDEWLNRQAVQAVLLMLAYYAAVLAADWVFGGLAKLLGWLGAYQANSAFSLINTVIGDLLWLGMIALCVVALLRVIRGREADLPCLSKLAEGDFAEWFAPKPKPAPPAYAPPAQAAPQQPPYAPPVAYPGTVYAPEPAAPEPAVPAGKQCPACKASIAEDARFCTACGTVIEPAAPAAEPEAPVGRQCPTCAAPLTETAKFCVKCGTKVS